ncbi:MAG: hypothetical protein E7211_14315 [Clostridium lundense]|nr:hypothetical protein [Clostridium lundense]
MYKVVIVNNGIETGIHYSNTDKEAPHLNELHLKEGLSQVDSLSFILYPNNPGYNLINELITKVKVIDTRDNSFRFTGRVLYAPEKMDSNGIFFKEVTCEGAMSYLNDSRQRANTFAATNLTDFLTQILAIHNSKVDSNKQMQVGNVDVTGSVAYTCNFGTTLAEILAVKEDIGGDIRVREVDGVLYLDWLHSFSENTIDITLGINMKDMVKDKDVTSFGTRIIPLGANNLTIASVNGGLDYIEDTSARAIYGVIEKPVEYRDIEDAQELYDTCLADISDYTQPLYLLEANALDLSCLSGNKAEQFTLGVNLHIYNPVMSVDSIYKAVLLDLDLLKLYDPKLTIANSPIKLSTAINDLRKSSIQNNGVYNNVQIGDSFGIRAVRSDRKIVTTLNATEGISIENLIKNIKVFYVDTEGNIIHDGKHQTTSDGKLLIENWKNDNGGIVQIYDNSGNLNVKIGSENGVADNVGGTIVLLKDCPDGASEDLFKRVALGILSATDEGIMQVLDTTGYPTITIRAGNTSANAPAQIRMIDSIGITEIKTDSITVGSEKVATESWVANYVATHMPIIPPPTA